MKIQKILCLTFYICLSYYVNATFPEKAIYIAGGKRESNHYKVAESVCRMINYTFSEKHIDNICIVRNTQGLYENLELLHAGEVDFALIQSDWQENIRKYYGDFAKFKNYDPIRSVLSLQEEIMTVVTRKYSKITSIDDIKGKVINLPMSNMSFKTMFSIFLRSKKWGIGLFFKVVDFSHSEQIRALCDGRIDATFLLVSHPDKTIDTGAKACELKILDIPMNFENPSISKSILKGGIYRGINKENSSIGMNILLVTTNKKENIIVKTLLESILNSLPEFKRSNLLLKHITRETLLKRNITTLYHPVVEKYLGDKKSSMRENGKIQKS